MDINNLLTSSNLEKILEILLSKGLTTQQTMQVLAEIQALEVEQIDADPTIPSTPRATAPADADLETLEGAGKARARFVTIQPPMSNRAANRVYNPFLGKKG